MNNATRKRSTGQRILRYALRNLALPVFFLAVVLLLLTIDLLFVEQFEWQNDNRLIIDRGLQLALWLTGTWLFSRAFTLLVWRGIVREMLGHRPPRLLIQIGGVLIFLLGLSGILHYVFGQPLTVLWATSGAVGLVIALALRTLILDMFSGMAIQIERPFRIGDWITCHTRFGHYIGRFEETNWRTTRLWSDNANIIVIPNTLLTTTIVTNFSLPDKVSMFELTFVLDFSAQPEHVSKVILAAAQEAIGPNGPLPPPPPQVRIKRVSQAGIEYCLEYHLLTSQTTPDTGRHTLVTDIVRHLRHSGLRLAYPRQDIFHTEMQNQNQGWRTVEGRIERLQKISLFSGLSTEEATFVAEHLSLRRMNRGDFVVELGEEGHSMFILAEGLLSVIADQDEARQIELTKLVPGDFFGETSLLTGSERTRTVKCETDALICEITKDIVSKLIEENPDISMQLSRAMAKREIENRALLDHLSEAALNREIDRSTGRFLTRLREFFEPEELV